VCARGYSNGRGGGQRRRGQLEKILEKLTAK